MNSRMSKKSKTTLFLSLTLAAVIFSAIHSNQYFMLGTDTQKSNEQNKRFGLEGDYDEYDLLDDDDYYDDDWLSEIEQQSEPIVAEGNYNEYDFDEYDILGDDDLIIEIEAKQKVEETTESKTRTI